MAQIEFKPRWREELEAISPDGKLVFELTMGSLHVYFPSHDRWLAIAPAWANGKWQIYHDACNLWCQQERIPITVTPDALFYEVK